MRRYGLDVLRGIAAFFIVGCHLQLLDYSAFGHAALHFCDMNVGVFAALSGFLMADVVDKINTPREYLGYVRKRILRIIPIYVFWSIIYLFSSALFQVFVGGEVKPKFTQCEFWLFVVFFGGASTHLWFLASLLYVQVLLAGFLKKINRIIWFPLSAVLVFISANSLNWWGVYPVRLLGFLLLGYSLSKFNIAKIIVAFWMMCAVLVHAIIPLHGFIKDWIIVSPIILLFANIFENKSCVGSFLSKTSMGIFLIHPLFTTALSFFIKKIFSPPYGIIPTLSVWVGAWFGALIVTIIFLRVKKIQCLIR